MTTRPDALTVEVIFDPECSLYVATCSALRLATEAPSFDALIERVRLIAPEIVEENGLHIAPKDLRLDFVYADVAPVAQVG